MVTKYFLSKLFSENENWTFLKCPNYSLPFHFTENNCKITFFFLLKNKYMIVNWIKRLLFCFLHIFSYKIGVLNEKMCKSKLFILTSSLLNLKYPN